MILTAVSEQRGEREAVAEIAARFSGEPLTFLIFFASPHYDAARLAACLREAFPEVASMGCTTAGEIFTGRMLEGSLVAMAFTPGNLEAFGIGVIRLEAGHTGEACDEALTALSGPIPSFDLSLDPQTHVGILLTDGLSGQEESLLSELRQRSDVPVIGGSAGDGLAMVSTSVFMNGEAFSKSAVFAVIRLKYGFDFIKTQSFSRLGTETLTATRCDINRRVVWEFNGEPARIAYARALGVGAGDLEEQLFTHPLGAIIEGDIYVRSPRLIQDDAIHFYSEIGEGDSLVVLKAGDIVADTSRHLLEKWKELSGRIAGIINFHCILRTLQLKAEGGLERYGDLFQSMPTVGFSTYGEQLFWHMNQTATMLVLLAPARKMQRWRETRAP